MTIYNREDSRTVLPQLEKEFNAQIDELRTKVDYNKEHAQDYEQITPTFRQCTNGAYTRCFKVGKIVMLSFNINITTGSANFDYLTDLPKAIGDFGTNGNGDTGTARIARFRITEDGTLRSDGTPTTGWHNGAVVYICKE